MQDQIRQIQERCKVAFAKAKELYGLDLSNVGIRFDLKGRAAGMACMRGVRGAPHFYMRFNRDMLTREAFEHQLNNTVPHEVAHIVCFMNPKLGRNHDSGWERVCIALGGTGLTRHQEEVVMGKGTTYEYTTDRGHKVRIGDRHHRKVQAGNPLIFRKGKGAINQFCSYSIVGMNGRTLANPIVRQAPNAPANIEAAVRSEQPNAEEMARRAALVEQMKKAQSMLKPVQRPAPVLTPAVAARPAATGESKAAISRRIMLAGYNSRKGYETIIAEMIAANGYDRQLARATFKANAPKVGIPASFYS